VAAFYNDDLENIEDLLEQESLLYMY